MLKKRKPAEPVEEPEEVEEDTDGDEDEVQPAAPPKRKSSPLLIFLLLLILLFGCCAISFVLANRFGIAIPGIGGGQPPVAATPVANAPTSEAQNPVITETVVAETPISAEPPMTNTTPSAEQTSPAAEGQLPAETTSEPNATAAPDGTQPTDESALPTSDASEATATATLVVPMDTTSTPGGAEEAPTEAAPVTDPATEATPEPSTSTGDCSANQPPIAQATGPNEAMMGKGLAMAVFEATGSTDPDGEISSYGWDFGDGDLDSGDSVTHGYAQLGSYAVTLTVTDNCGATSQSKVNVTVTGPTPPAMTTTPAATGTVAATPMATTTPESEDDAPVYGTLGFCHYVQPGQTLYGIAAYHGVSWADLAAVNEVSPEYMVRAGQGLFVPSEALTNGPNLYQVEADETLYDIAYQCGISPVALAKANGLDVEAEVAPGQVITIPLWH